jgi:hypothetical protein
MDTADDNIVVCSESLHFAPIASRSTAMLVLPKNWIVRMRRPGSAKVEAGAAIQHPFCTTLRGNSSVLNEISVRMVRVTRDEAQSQDQVA